MSARAGAAIVIRLTLYNDADIVVNSDLIESVERTPDTLISLTTGKKIMVKESVEDVISRVVAYRREISRTVASWAAGAGEPR